MQTVCQPAKTRVQLSVRSSADMILADAVAVAVTVIATVAATVVATAAPVVDSQQSVNISNTSRWVSTTKQSFERDKGDTS